MLAAKTRLLFQFEAGHSLTFAVEEKLLYCLRALPKLTLSSERALVGHFCTGSTPAYRAALSVTAKPTAQVHEDVVNLFTISLASAERDLKRRPSVNS